MRKVINVITLIVMVSVNLMNPFAYAISTGDNFDEIQNFVEGVQEDGDFYEEENIEDVENEEDGDEYENDEEENSIDEEIEQQDEEEQESLLEDQDNESDIQNNEEKDEDSENEEDDYEEDSENEDNSIDEEMEQQDENKTPIDILNDLVNGKYEDDYFSGEVLTGDIENLSGEMLDLTGENLKLTGEVIELTGVNLELSIARETLNNNPIIGTDSSKGVTVNVEAQPGTFPEGTELRIKPITLKKELNEIKDQIIDSQKNVSEDSELVAFDISFIYTLSGGNEVEVQPKNREGVKVTFDYTDNKTLSEADNNDEQEVKVFHIDDKDDNGEKVEKGEEVVKDVTNEEESKEEGIAVADAESFSVYVVVSASSILEPLTVTYNLRGGYWTEEGEVSTGNKNITYEYDSTVTLVSGKKYYKPTSTYKTPSKAGNTCNGKKCMFKGWYTDTGGNNRWNGTVSSDMTVYAKWLPFDDLHVYFLVDETNIIHETIMDRNLGATEIYSQDYSKQKAAARGDYFQWGNNYAFGTSINGLEQITENTRVPASIWELGVPSKYYSSVYYKKDKETWTIGNSKGLWGGLGDTDSSIGEGTTYEGRQGPCPDGYHIPSAISRKQLFDEWNLIYNYVYSNVMNIDKGNNNHPIVVGIRNGLGRDLLLPPTGRWGGTSLGNVSDDLSYWASSHNENDEKTAYGFYIGKFGIQPRGVQSVGGGGDGESRGRAIRCFKNPENDSSYLGNIDLNGGTGGIISIINGEVKALKEPTRGNDEFRGWYTTSSGNLIEIGSTLQQGDSLYAKWCADGSFDDGSQCINGYIITFDSDGGSSVPNQIVISGETGTRPEDPTKDGYLFSGWFIDNETFQNEFDFDIPITSNITIYAKWTLKTYTISYELNGGEVATSNPTNYTIETQDFTLHNPTRVGYDFLGWSGTNLPVCSVEEHSTCSETVSIQQGSTGNRVYEAIFDAEKHNLNFDSLGGNDVQTQRIPYGETGTRPENPTKDGYSFVGWYYTGLQTEFDFNTPITSNITIYAKWTLKTYTIGYELNGGILSGGVTNPTTYTKESNEIILNNPIRDWFIFEGWSGTNLQYCSMEDTSNCIKTVTIPHGSTGDRTYEAIWGYVKHDLNFDSLGGSEVSTQKVIHGETGTIPESPTKNGYSFDGWYYTGLQIEFNFTGTAIISDVTVYAKWSLVDYNIIYNLNGGTGLANTGVYTKETETFTLNNPTKLNYVFIGWSGTNLPGCSVENQTTCNKNVSITQGSTGDRVYEAIYDCAYGRKLDGTCNIVRKSDGLIDYDNWEYNDLEVDLSVTEPVKIIIMDRNLGAAISGSGTNENAYGFFYQWGNNYGFSYTGELEKFESHQVDASAFGPGNYYVSDVFLENGSGWDSSNNTNLWGGAGDVWNGRGEGDDEARQGPCPSGYHIPSVNEGRKLTELVFSWKDSGIATNLCSGFSSKEACVMEKLRLPKAGNRNWLTQIERGFGRFWTSTRFDQNEAYRIALTNAGNLVLGQNNDLQKYSISNGMSVRCFKNVSSKPLVYELSGGVQTSNATSTVVWWNEGAGTKLTIPTKTGYVFEGWYLTSGYERGTKVTTNVITDYSNSESVTLYANWKDAEYKTITYDAKGGYFSGGLLSTGIVYKEDVMSGNYVALTNVQFPNREGYMFDGWYLTGGETEWTGYVDNSTEEQIVYAKWLGFDDLTLTMSGITFTIMDRNLGATDYATGYTYGSDNEQSNKDRIGKYYQWGNNYGFSSSKNLKGNTFVDNTDDFGPGNYYSSPLYVYSSWKWGNTHKNLWGGLYLSSGDETRQGPCPVNYHVPTKNEWDKVISLFNVWKHTEEGISYCNNLENSGDKYCFSARLGLPFAGYLDGSNNLRERGTFGSYRSSNQRDAANNPYRMRLSNMQTEILSNGYGNTVRCFKDTKRKTLNFESKSGVVVDAPTEIVRWWETTTPLPTPTRSNSIFSGWYTTSGYEEGTKLEVNYILTGSDSVTLYAKWDCEDGYEESEDGNSCTKFSYTVTYDSTTNGGTTEEQTERVENGAHPTLLYTGYKEGWTFVGWNTNSGATVGLTSNEITVTGPVTLYAIYKKEVKTLGISSYSLNGQGITYWGGLNDYSLSCTLPEVYNNDEQDTSCDVTMPFVLIYSGSRREFVGINDNSGSTENASNVVREPYDLDVSGFKTPVYSGRITLTEETSGKTWYIISKYPSVTLTGNFYGNGSTILGETSTGCTIGEIYNNAAEVTTCTVTTPEVSPSENTPTFVGWNMNSLATGNDTTYYNEGELILSLANGVEQDWYAITKSSEVWRSLLYVMNGNKRYDESLHSYTSVDYLTYLCSIESSYNGNPQANSCVANMNNTVIPFVGSGNKEALGWSLSSATGSEIAYRAGDTITLEMEGNLTLYAQSVLTGGTYGVIFSGNGATLGTNYDSKLLLTCTGENSYNGEDETKSNECNITIPEINRNEYVVQGYTGTQDYEVINENLLTGGNNLKLSSANSGNIYYVSSYKPITLTFNRNGNTAQIKSGTTVETTDDIIEVCNIWNTKQDCSIRTPEIIPADGKVVKGYSTSGDSFENEVSHQTPISVSESNTYYAWSESIPVTYTANYVIGTGINPIAVTSGSCTTDIKYNSEEIVNSCEIQLPEITTQVGYIDPKWYIGDVEVVLDDERKTTLTGNVVFEAKATIEEYTVTFYSNGGSPITGQIKEYGSTVDEPEDPIKNGYGFSGWYLDTGLTQKYDFATTVAGDLDLYAKWTPIKYTISYNLNSGSVSEANPINYTIETETFTLNNPTRVGYKFLGWSGTDIEGLTGTVIIMSGSIGNREYTANWEARDDILITIKHNFQDLDLDTNELKDTYSLSGTTTGLEIADSEIVLSNYSGNFDGYVYVYGKDDINGDPVETTTVLPDGSRIINLYYTRNKYNFTLITNSGSTTVGSTSSGQYYYGSKIILSGDVNSDCFVWSGWDIQGATLENNINQTSFYMPAGSVTVESSVREKTYNIIFNGNGEDSGEMSPINGIKCTQEVILPNNSFVKTGYTFTGWTTTPNGEKEFDDGARFHTLTTGDNVTIEFIAIWDINYYPVVWKDYDGDVLYEDKFAYMHTPVYHGEIPSRDADAQYTYSFAGWNPEIHSVTGAQVYTAVYNETLNEYTVTWDVDGMLTMETYKYGENPNFTGSKHKDPDVQYEYTFAGWSPAIKPVTGDITYTATYNSTLRSYLIVWLNYDGSELQSGMVEYGKTPLYSGATPTRPSEPGHTYEFIGWTPAVIPVEGEAVYWANFSGNLNKYTITWVNYDNTPLEIDTGVVYGTMPSYDGATPTKESDAQYDYEFSGWTPETGTVVKDQTYVATYTSIPRTYTITWKNSDGSVIKEDTGVVYGTNAEYVGQTPTSGSSVEYDYEFIGWNPALGVIDRDTTYTAVYKSNKRKYLIRFVNGETELQSGMVEYGVMPVYTGEDPIKTGDVQYSYNYVGWTPGIFAVTGDMTYEAKFDSIVNKYSVTFVNDDSSVLKPAKDYDYGTLRENVEKPANPTKPSDEQYDYEFSGWIPVVSQITGDVEFMATYTGTLRTYTVTWKNDDGTVLETDYDVPYGTTPSYDGATPEKPETSQHEYVFKGWDPEVSPVHGDITYTAQFVEASRTYTITWVDDDGTELEVDTGVVYGTMPSYDGATPTKESSVQYDYEFSGWTPVVIPVEGDQTYVATYTSSIRTYTVTWKNGNIILETDNNVPYGTTPSYDGETPVRTGNAQYSYTFAGWAPDISPVSTNTVYYATFTETINKYVVLWENDDGSILDSNQVPYGEMPVYSGATPTKTATAQYTYTFNNTWFPEIEVVKTGAIYIAQFDSTVNKYTITWVDGDGNTLKTEEIEYGEMPVYSGATPTKTGNPKHTYTFNNTWSPEIVSVTEDATYVAQFDSDVNEYTITWVDGDGNTLKTEEIEYGEMPVYSGATPTKTATAQYTYTFNNTWSPAVVSVTDDATYVAQFDSDVNKYTITIGANSSSGSVSTGELTIEYGTPITTSGNELKIGEEVIIATPNPPTPKYTHEFSGWNNSCGVLLQSGCVIEAEFRSIVNKYTITIGANSSSGSVSTGELTIEYGTPITTSGNELKIGDEVIIATPNPPTPKYTHEFSGWNNSCGTSLQSGCTIEAEFRSIINRYTITWKNSNGNVLSTGKWDYGVTPEYNGSTPTSGGNAQYSYLFSGWNPAIGVVEGNTEYTATYTQITNEYTITWKDGDGNTLKTEEIEYGETPSYTGAVPTKTATAQYTYTFNNSWSPTIVSVTDNATYTAQFDSTVNKYAITWKDGNGDTLKTEDIEYGETPDYTGAIPTKTATAQYSYIFNNTWAPAIVSVIEKATYIAQFDSIINNYTVIWQNEDGEELEKDENIPYGTMPNYDGITPIKPGGGSGNYIFDGWNPTPTIVKGDVIYTAKYKNKTEPKDGGSGKRRSGSGGRKHVSEQTGEHGVADGQDGVNDVDKEVFDAYKRAYKYGITTMDTEEAADPDGYVTRGHLAKMVVNFAVNVLGRDMPVDTPTKCERKDNNSEWESDEIKFYAKKACALGIMGVYMEEFIPNKIVDRAEFGTVVSRLLWGNIYDELDTDNHLFYTKHLKALQESGFMKDIDNPLGRKEFRKRVWVTLKRIELEKNKK